MSIIDRRMSGCGPTVCGVRVTIIVLVASFLASVCLADAPVPMTRPAEGVLYDQPIGDAGGLIVVVRGPEHQVALFKSIMQPELTQQLESLCEVRVELHFPKEKPVLVTSRLVWQYPHAPALNDIAVLDVLVEKDVIIVGFAEGAFLSLWQVPLGTTVGWSVDVPPGESLAAARRPLNKVAHLKLSRLPDGRLGYEVNKYNRFHSTYEQRELGAMEFKPIRTWDDGPPKK